MSDDSPRLGLPYIAPAQAQKHVTHNEALQRLDALSQMSFVDVGVDAPPASPQAGDLYGVGPAPTGDWAGQAGQIAYRADSGWMFLDPQTGWRAWDQTSGTAVVYTAGGWQAEGAGPGTLDTQNLSGLGIGTTSDATNKLAVAAEATLLTHGGAGHQLKVNKAADTDVASLLFQSNWQGHAEMGLSGDTNFAIKVSADGSAWAEAMKFDAATGLATGASVQSSATDTTPGRLATTQGSYGPGSVLGPVSLSAGVPTGAVIERATNANGTYIRFADGTQICWVSGWTFAEEGAGNLLGGGNWTFPAAFAEAPVVTPSFGTATGSLWQGVNTHRRVSCFGCDATTSAATALQVFSHESTPFSTGAQATGVRLLAIGTWA